MISSAQRSSTSKKLSSYVEESISCRSKYLDSTLIGMMLPVSIHMFRWNKENISSKKSEKNQITNIMWYLKFFDNIAKA
jgi:hypothetical protein